jgi:hypothetical protein
MLAPLSALSRGYARVVAWCVPPGAAREAQWRAQIGVGLALTCLGAIALLGVVTLSLSPAQGVIVVAMAVSSLAILPLMRWRRSADIGAHYLALVTLAGVLATAQLKGGLMGTPLQWLVAPLLGCTLALGPRKVLPWLVIYAALPLWFAATQDPAAWPAALGPPWVYAIMRVGALALAFWLVSLLERERWRAWQALSASQEEAARQNHEMRLLLDNAEQAFLTLDAAGQRLGPPPAALARWWGEEAPPASLAALLGRADPGAARRVEAALREGALAALPGALSLGGRELALAYKALPQAPGERAALLVIVTDTTAARLQRRAERQQEDLLALFGLDQGEVGGLSRRWAEGAALFARATASREALEPGALLALQRWAEDVGAQGLAEVCQEALKSGHSRHLLRAWRGLQERVEPALRGRAEVAAAMSRGEYEALLGLLAARAPRAQIERALSGLRG